jgi:hypothetical protein
MRPFVYLLTVLLLLVLVPGCGSDKEKGMNRPSNRQDLPRSAPPEKGK